MKLGKIKGDKAPDLWKFFKAETGAADPGWNFQGKFLVSKTGVVSVSKGDVEAEITALMNE
jgi:glutathione peroxidase-family protein